MIDVRDRGFLLGDGVFETLLVGNRVACWRDDHLNRMKKAARKLDILFDRERIDAEIDAMLATSASGAHVMRVTLSRGLTLRGLAADGDVPTLSVTLDSYDTALIGKPMNLTKSSIRRNPSSVTDRHKTTSYANNVFAAREAKARGADAQSGRSGGLHVYGQHFCNQGQCRAYAAGTGRCAGGHHAPVCAGSGRRPWIFGPCAID
jgi:branched-chain amino acid aminotransferase